MVSAGLNRLLLSRDAKGMKRVKQVNPFHPRVQVQTLVTQEGVGLGLLSEMQSELVERVLSMKSLYVRDEMIPWQDVVTVKTDTEPQAIWQLAQKQSRSRYPLLDDAGGVVGVVNLYEVLLHEVTKCPPLAEFAEPVLTMKADLPLRDALATLQRAKVALAIVVGDAGKPVGIVSMKDLVEPITGELQSW